MFLAQVGGIGDDYIIYSSDTHNGLHMRTSWCEYACLSSWDTDVEKVVRYFRNKDADVRTET
jgi:hypothetical protein